MPTGEINKGLWKKLWLPGLSVLFLSLTLVAVSWVCFFADSEMWPSIVSRDFFVQKESFSVGMKLVFHLLLYLNSVFASFFDFHPIYSARVLFALLALASMSLVAKIVFNQTKSIHLALLAVLFLGSSGIFIDRAYRVRSDHLASFFCLLALFYFLYRPQLPRRGVLVVGVLFLLAFFSTPKATLLILSLSPFWLPAFKSFFQNRDQMRIPKKVLIPLVLALICIAGFFGVFVDLFRASLFFANSFGEKETLIPYWSSVRFVHVIGFFRKDPHFILGILATVVSGIFLSRSLGGVYKKLSLMSLLLVIVLAIYPDRMPFLIASFLPFWTVAIFGNPVLVRGVQGLQSWRLGPFLLGLVSVLLVGKSVNRAHFIWNQHNNFEQKKAIESLNLFFKQSPGLKIYDPVGILYGLATYTWYLGPGQGAANRWALEQVKIHKVDVILRTQRLDWFGSDLKTLLAASYSEIAPDLWARFARLDIRKLPRLADRKSVDQEISAELGSARFGPGRALYLRVLDGAGQDISSRAEIIFKDSTRPLRLDQIPVMGLSHSDYYRIESIQLPLVASDLIVSDFKFVDLGLRAPLSFLFRFDSEL